MRKFATARRLYVLIVMALVLPAIARCRFVSADSSSDAASGSASGTASGSGSDSPSDGDAEVDAEAGRPRDAGVGGANDATVNGLDDGAAARTCGWTDDAGQHTGPCSQGSECCPSGGGNTFYCYQGAGPCPLVP
jgi:hypothetical protein